MADNDYTRDIRRKLREWVLQNVQDDDLDRLRKMLWVNEQFVNDWKTFPPSEIGKSESPIEALLFISVLERGNFKLSRASTIDELIVDAMTGGVWFAQQVRVAPFRLDFLFCAYTNGVGPTALCVECDGWEHHYTSLQKVHEDNMRIGYLAKKRIFTMRFIGSEIVKSAGDAVRQIEGFFEVTGD